MATGAGNATLATIFTTRAAYIQQWYLKNMWSDESEFFGVYKQGLEFDGMGGCTTATLHNQTDSGCCCVAESNPTGHYANFSTALVCECHHGFCRRP
jgi:hypothetical protein